MYENLLTRDPKTGQLSPILAEHWQMLVAPEPWEVIFRGGYTRAALNPFMEHPKLDEFIDRLAVQPDPQERTRIMRDEMGPWLQGTYPVSLSAPLTPSPASVPRWATGRSSPVTWASTTGST